MVRSGSGGFEHHGLNRLAAAEWLQLCVGEGGEQFEFFGKTQNRPCLTACPSAEACVALLGIRATVGTVLGIENRLVGRASAFVVGIASLAVENRILRRGVDVLQRAIEQAHGFVTLGHQDMPELVRFHENAAGANGVNEEGVRAVEAVNESPTLTLGPTGGLNGAAGLDGEFVEILLPFVFGETALEHQAAEVSIGRKVVETMVVDTDVRDMRGHAANGVVATAREAFLIARGIKMEDRYAVAEALGPFGPAARRVFSGNGEDGRSLAFIVFAIDCRDFRFGE